MENISRFYLNHKKPIVIFTQLLILVIIFWFLAGRISDGLQQAADVLQKLHWQLFVATGLFTSAVVVSGVLWGGLVNILGSHPPIKSSEAIRVHSLAWLFKYFPGQGGGVISKVLWGKKNGIERKAVLTSVLYENIFLASSSIILSVPFLGFTILTEISGKGSLLIPLLLAISVFPLLVPQFFSRVLAVGLKLIGREPPTSDLALSIKNVLKNQLIFLIPRLINGLGFVLIASIFITPNLFDTIQLSGAYILGGIIGILAFFVPSGIGVREAVIVIGAGSVLGTDFAIAAAIIARVCATAGDVLVALIYGILKGINGRN